MPRSARVVIPGCPHHVTQRGNNGQDVFFVDDDRQVFLSLLGNASTKFGLGVEGYCLMTNHVHLVVTPTMAEALGQALKRVSQLYTQYVNRLHGRSGHLWQDRFFSCPLDEEHYWTAMAYVERNPIRAGLCRSAWQWRWSSAAAHCDGRDTSGLLNMAAWRERLPADGDWSEALGATQGVPDVKELRLATSRGRPLGSDSFVSKIEQTLGRRLRPLPIGRPRREELK